MELHLSVQPFGCQPAIDNTELIYRREGGRGKGGREGGREKGGRGREREGGGCKILERGPV